jgi:hypothetical protein
MVPQRHQSADSFVFEAIGFEPSLCPKADRAGAGSGIIGDPLNQFFEQVLALRVS